MPSFPCCTTPHSAYPVTFDKVKPGPSHSSFPRSPLQLCPSLLSSGMGQGRGKRKMEEVDKEVRHAILKVAALPDAAVRAQGASHHWGSWGTRAGHTVGHSCPDGQL